LYVGRTEPACVLVRLMQFLFADTRTHREASEKMKRIVATAVAVLALLALPTAAFASGSSTCSAYNPQLCQVVNHTSDASSGSLPFTGLDLGLVAAGGVVLIGAGLAARKFSAQR
jgi:hypothetical protein